MKTLLSVTLVLLLILPSHAQKVYFIYLQTDNNTPFYAKMSDKVFSSSTAGHVTLSNLVDSTYTISIGFPSGRSESKFIIPLHNRDKGFIIKNSDNGIILFDLESASVIKPQPSISKGSASYEVRTDLFTTLLAKAAGDSSLLYVAIIPDNEVKKEEKNAITAKVEENKIKEDQSKENPPVVKTESKEPEIKKDTSTAIASNVSITNPVLKDTLESVKHKDQAITDQVQKNLKTTVDSTTSPPVISEYRRSVVKKYSESSTSEGFGLVYHDIYEGGIDTIRLTIPNPKFQYKLTEPETKVEEKQADQKVTNTISNSNKKAPENISEKKDSVLLVKDSAQQKPLVSGTSIIKKVKPACPILASENEFLKLRRNMVARSNDEEMVNEAKKIFKNRCFSTEQIKSLGSLFLTSAGKYEFFNASYSHVKDQEQFASLQTEIKDDYYLKRFKALVRE